MVVLKKVSDLDPVGTLASTDQIVINQSDGVSRKVNIAQIQGYGFVLTNMIGASNGIPSLVSGFIPDNQIGTNIARSSQLTPLSNSLVLKADISSSVDLSSAQTISGVKTFSNGLL